MPASNLNNTKSNVKKEIFLRIILLLFGLVLALVLAELILRLGAKQEYYQGAILEGASKPKSRVLILGDSFLTPWSGEGISDFLVKDLAPQGAQILNTAEGGNSPLDYLTAMKAYGKSFKPDLVLLFYYVGNDLTGVQYPGGRWNALKKSLKPILMKSKLFYFIKEERKRLFERRINYKEIQKSGIAEQTIQLAQKREINPWLLDLSRQKKDFILDNLLMENPENMKAWGGIQKYLEEINRLTQKIHSQLIIIFIPHTLQVNRSHWDFYQELNFHLDDKLLNAQKPQDLLKVFCQENKIACLDLLPGLKAQSSKEFYRDNDDHFNRDGADAAEKETLEFIIQKRAILK